MGKIGAEKHFKTDIQNSILAIRNNQYHPKTL